MHDTDASTLFTDPHRPTRSVSNLTVEIRPVQGWVPLNVRELWESRGLLSFLVWRDIRLRYTQTVLGVAWAVLKPLSVVAVFSLVFGWFVQVPSRGLPYPIFTYCGLLPWQLFAHTVVGVSNSLVTNQSLLTKVYFPRLLLPFSAAVVGIIDFLIASLVLIGMMGYYRFPVTDHIWVAPLFVLLTIMVAMGVGLWLAVLNVRYRDVGHVLPFLLQGWMFATPVIYPSSLVPDSWQIVLGANPMASIVEGMRWSILAVESPPALLLVLSVGITVILFFSGLYGFRRMEQTFADEV
jgi:homopolymeric O-antigen transport system permease protein